MKKEIEKYFQTLETVSKEKSLAHFGEVNDSFRLGYYEAEFETLLAILNLSQEQLVTLEDWTECFKLVRNK